MHSSRFRRPIFPYLSVALGVPLAVACSVTTTPLSSGAPSGADVDGGSTPIATTPSGVVDGGSEGAADGRIDSSARDGAGTDAALPDGQNDATAPAGRKRVFATLELFTGDLKTQGRGADGPSGADNLCTAAAVAGGLGGTWKAWLSVNGTSKAEDRIADVGPWYLVDRTTLVFPNKQALAGAPAHEIDRDELNGGGPGPDWLAWTGTHPNIAFKGDDCAGWASDSSAGSGVSGDVNGEQSGSYGWTDLTTSSCDTRMSLYCFEQ